MSAQRDDPDRPPPKVIIIGEDLKRGLSSPQPQPTQADLDAIIGPATRVVVREFGNDMPAIIDTDKPADLAALRDALRIEMTEVGHCMCFGDEQFEFLRGDVRLGIVSLHHGESIRWEPFFNNAALTCGDLVRSWLSAHGWSRADERFQDDVEERRREKADVERWRAAMPRCILAGFDPSSMDVDEPRLAAALRKAHPDEIARTRMLFEWFGQGAGPWSGYPSYEEAPLFLLLATPMSALLAAAQSPPTSTHLLEGAARLFASWDFSQKRKEDLKRLPFELKQRLLTHSFQSSDGDKRARAQYAFKSSP